MLDIELEQPELTDDQLITLANQAVSTTPETPAPAAVIPSATPTPTPDDPTIEAYSVMIDLEDGGGVQVFEADTKDELIEKLAEAQRNGTRKIRELSKTITPTPAAAVAPVVRTPMDEAQISQKLLSEPTEAFKDLFQSTVGMDIETFKTKQARLDAFERGQREQQVALEWVSATPDYYAVPTNAEKLGAFLELHRLEATPDNLSRAFNDLSASGLLAKKPGPKPAEPRIEEPPAPTPVKRTSSISTRTATTAPITPPGPTEADIDKMTDDQLYEMALRSVRK